MSQANQNDPDRTKQGGQVERIVIHNPKFRYDCLNCKFAWNCGYTCACIYRNLPDPDKELQLKINEIRKQKKLSPEY